MSNKHIALPKQKYKNALCKKLNLTTTEWDLYRRTYLGQDIYESVAENQFKYDKELFKNVLCQCICDKNYCNCNIFKSCEYMKKFYKALE